MEIKRIGDLTVSDVWELACTQAPGGDKYFVTFTDGKSQWTMKNSNLTKVLLKLKLGINSRSFVLMVGENTSARNLRNIY